MRIIIKNKNEVVWYRNTEKGEGMASKGYTKDGTQHEIISALEYALQDLVLCSNIHWTEQ
ncbi:MAG TPA: Rrf2 family transcriptional regulator [Arsenophonus nasoniae]|uniref:Rrf2 family transcriptional regulator n=1 Tax=Arsenophonus nasoniae TaxID=638 RepID=UPI00387A1CFC